MKSFANKMHAGGVPKFDPMLEERGGSIVGEVPRQDEEMTKVVIGIMAEVSQHVKKGTLNPFCAQIGQILPPNVERNFNGFFVRKEAITFKVDFKSYYHILLC